MIRVQTRQMRPSSRLLDRIALWRLGRAAMHGKHVDSLTRNCGGGSMSRIGFLDLGPEMVTQYCKRPVKAVVHQPPALRSGCCDLLPELPILLPVQPRTTHRFQQRSDTAVRPPATGTRANAGFYLTHSGRSHSPNNSFLARGETGSTKMF